MVRMKFLHLPSARAAVLPRRRALRQLAAAPLMTALPSSAAAQTQTPALVSARAASAPELSADEARRDLRVLKRALLDLHPGLTRYTTLAQLDADFAAAQARVEQGASRATMYLLASRLAASVRCGHTWASPYNQGKAIVDNVFGRSDKLPLTLRWVQGRALVTGSLLPELPAGSELLAIDGRPMAAIAAALMPSLRADGNGDGSDAKRFSQLDSHGNGGAMDRLFPLMFAPSATVTAAATATSAVAAFPPSYRLQFVRPAQDRPGERVAAAVAEAERDRVLAAPDSQWRFSIEGDTGLLTLPTFAFWRSSFDPKAFLAQSFAALSQVPFLIIDQRRNEGGDDSIGRALLAQLLKAPATLPTHRVDSAYERVPYELARFLDTWDFGFFDRTGTVRKGAGRNWLLADRPGQRVEPVAKPYAGRTLVLVGPQNSSAGFLLARDLKATGAATLMGQTTGGNLRGLNGGQLAWINLPHSGVGVDIPLLASFPITADGSEPPDSGVVPDITIAPSFEDAQAGRDTELIAARLQVAVWRMAGRTR